MGARCRERRRIVERALPHSGKLTILKSTCWVCGTTRAEDSQGTPTQSHISPSILVYEDKTHQHCSQQEPGLTNLMRKQLTANVQRFRGGLVFKAHRLCVSLNSRLERNKEEERAGTLRCCHLKTARNTTLLSGSTARLPIPNTPCTPINVEPIRGAHHATLAYDAE